MIINFHTLCVNAKDGREIKKLYLLTLALYFTLAAFQIHFGLFSLIVHQRNSNLRNIKLLLSTVKKKRRLQRCWIKKGRTFIWWENFERNEVPLSAWKENFRMSRKSFVELCNMLRPYLQRKTTQMRQQISFQKQVAAFLYYISDEGRYRKTGKKIFPIFNDVSFSYCLQKQTFFFFYCVFISS